MAVLQLTWQLQGRCAMVPTTDRQTQRTVLRRYSYRAIPCMLSQYRYSSIAVLLEASVSRVMVQVHTVAAVTLAGGDGLVMSHHLLKCKDGVSVGRSSLAVCCVGSLPLRCKGGGAACKLLGEEFQDLSGGCNFLTSEAPSCRSAQAC
jgi:hypothetical protein